MTAAAARQAASDRARVDAFVARHFRLAGTLRLHRHAVGWDLLRAPANVILAPVYLLGRLFAVLLHTIGLRHAARWLAGRRILFPTAVARAVAVALRRDLLAARNADTPAGTVAADRAIEDYATVRSAIGEIVTTSLILILGIAVFRMATPGVISLAPLVTEQAARATAVSNFLLGERLGGVWYGLFPVALPVWWVVAMGILLAMTASVVTTFAGILADPLQARLGLHRRRLMRLLARLDARREGAGAPEPEHVVARSADIFDAVLNLWRHLRP